LDTVVTSEDVNICLQCDLDVPTCLATSDEIIMRDVIETANQVNFTGEGCSNFSPDSKVLEEADGDIAPKDKEAADAFTTCIRWLKHPGYPDFDFASKISELRDYADQHT
jgi:hypothetical protein